MSTLTKTVNNATVFYDSAYTDRWYDAIGPDVVKYLQEFVTWPDDDTTHDPTEFVVTMVEVGGASSAVITDAAGGAALFTAAGNDNDGVKLQLGGGSGGECVKLDGSYPLYMGIKFQMADVDQSDLLYGVCITDTSCLDGVTDGLYFRTVDEDAELFIVAERNSFESLFEVATLEDATDVTAEFLFDGSHVYVYIDGTRQASFASTIPNFPDDEELRLTFEFLSGEAVANTATVKWMRMIHLRG
jgi:hypothetical protein